MGRGYVSERAAVLGRSAMLAALLASTAIGASLLGMGHTALAQATEIAFDIPAGPLSQALASFGRQAGMQVTYGSALATGKTSPGVSGAIAPDAALAELLQGTGLGYSFVGIDTVSIDAPGATAIAADGTIALEEIDVTAWVDAASGSGFMGTPDRVYETPTSLSVISREAIAGAAIRNTRDLLDNVAGVYANRSEGQNPGVAVNIRGLQDQNRVVTMIDGARQNFQRNGHGSTQRTYIDSAFIRSVEIEKTGTSAVGGAGSLGGSVNFRTVGAGDLIAEGEIVGFETTVGTGTNAYNFENSALAAIRLSDGFSITAGYSGTNIGAYKLGENGEIELSDFSVRDGEVVSTGQQAFASILKAEAELSPDLDVSAAWIRNDSRFSHGSYSLEGELTENTQDVVTNTLTTTLDWDPESPLIDLKARLWYNHTDNAEVRGASTVTGGVDWPVDYSLGTLGGSLENTSSFDTPVGLLSLNYGGEAYFDRGVTETDTFYLSDGSDFTASFTGMTPSGNRDVYSAFANATLEHEDWLTVSGGLRYDYYRLHGSASVYGLETTTVDNRVCVRYFSSGACRTYSGTIDIATTYPETVIDVDQAQGELLPTAKLAFKPVEWLQPFVSYARSMRPPSIMETFFTGGHPGAAVVTNAPNPDLLAEVGDTYEVGVNITQDGLFSPDDSLRLKAVGFYRDIENYISTGLVTMEETGREHTAYVNVDGSTIMKGVELEASYDAGDWYGGLSYTWLHTDFGDSYSYNGTSYDVAPSVIFVPPEHKFTLDAGVRLLERKLTLGGRMSYVGGTSPNIGLLTASYVTKDYAVFDLYGSYQFNDNLTLRAAINNVTDLAYVPALGTTSLPAPGRTATVSLNLKF
jgi:hemoglobin/transferrin/lactoferrin receptor protein